MSAAERAAVASRTRVLYDTVAEMDRQDAKWGEQNPPDYLGVITQYPLLRPAIHGLISEHDARNMCEAAFKQGRGTWAHILIEEVAEALSTNNVAELRTELVQCAAVIVQWVRAIDRRS